MPCRISADKLPGCSSIRRLPAEPTGVRRRAEPTDEPTAFRTVVPKPKTCAREGWPIPLGGLVANGEEMRPAPDVCGGMRATRDTTTGVPGLRGGSLISDAKAADFLAAATSAPAAFAVELELGGCLRSAADRSAAVRSAWRSASRLHSAGSFLGGIFATAHGFAGGGGVEDG